jgi:hypothetical protein
VRKQKDTAQFPRSEFRDRLDSLLAAGQRAGISITEIAGMLEGRAQGLRHRHTMSSAVESAGILPRVTRYEGDKNASMIDRIKLAVRGD